VNDLNEGCLVVFRSHTKGFTFDLAHGEWYANLLDRPCRVVDPEVEWPVKHGPPCSRYFEWVRVTPNLWAPDNDAVDVLLVHRSDILGISAIGASLP
jgi:hypothetical protein